MQQQNEFSANSNIGDGAIDPSTVSAQTAGADFVERLDAALDSANDTHGANMNEEVAEQDSGELSFADHGYTKSIFTKKLPDPAKNKRRKKIAAASRRRNRRA